MTGTLRAKTVLKLGKVVFREGKVVFGRGRVVIIFRGGSKMKRE
jgi:hypothetical protein